MDVQHRALSVMLLAHQLKQRCADMNVITTPSLTTAALCTKLGWSQLPVGEWNRSGLWVTNHARAVRSYLDATCPKWISNLLKCVISPPLFLKDALSRRPRAVEGDYRLDWCDSFDSSFDIFCDELQERYPKVLLGTRNSQTLHWHFKTALNEKRIWVLTARTGSRLLGYTILERRDVCSVGLTRVLFIDLQILSRDSALCLAMVDAILKRCRREGIHLVENAGCWIEKTYPVRAPYWRNLEAWSYLYRITNPELERSLLADSWFPTQYDGDASL